MNSKHPAETYIKIAEANPFLSNKKIAEFLSVDEASVRRAFKKAGYRRGLIPVDAEKALQTLDKPIILKGNVALMADVHNPLTDWKYVNRFVDDCVSSGITQVLFCGDFWHCDQYGSYYPKQSGIQLEDEIPEGNKLMAYLLTYFETASFIKGNHDYRYVKGKNYKMSFVDAMLAAFAPLGQARDRITFSNLDHAIIDEDGGWYICHPPAYSRTPLAGSRAISVVQGMSVATAHSHHCARGFAPNGIHQAMELGGFFDAKRTAYLQTSSTFPKWTQGYAIMQDGKMRLESPAWSTR